MVSSAGAVGGFPCDCRKTTRAGEGTGLHYRLMGAYVDSIVNPPEQRTTADRGTRANPAAPRHCLPCTACCQGWLSATIQGHIVSAGKPCPHSRPTGCAIYAERPDNPCRTFTCSWLVDNSPLPEWMRPDQCGAIVLLSLPWQGQKVISAIPVGRLIPEPTLHWLKQYAEAHQRPLIFYERLVADGAFSGLKRFGFGPPEFRRQVERLAAEEVLSAIEMHSA